MLTLLLMAQLAAAPPATRFELPNGLRVWVQEDHSRPVALVHVTYHAGSLNEGPGITGIAHYVEHMAYRATENIRNEDVYGYIDRIGGRYTGGTWPDVTRYAETVPSWAVESALRVTAERMTRALFDSVEFERERSNVVTEAHGFADLDPANALRDQVMMTAFELHPYRYNSNTWARDNLTLARAQAFAWYKEHYGPNNAVLVVAGDVSTDEVRRLVEKHFAVLPRAPGSSRIGIAEPERGSEVRIWRTAPADSSVLEIAYRLPPATDPIFPALVRFDQIFAPRLRAEVAKTHPGVRIETTDTITAYPYVYRISAVGPGETNMTSVLGTVDKVIYAFWTDTIAIAKAVATERPAPPRPAAALASAVPPRQSKLTRIAESLAARELPPWEPSSAVRDSIAARASRRSVSEVRGVAQTLITPPRRVVGILTPANPYHRVTPRLDIPALSVPPAKRARPELVPARALEPLAPLSMEHGVAFGPDERRLYVARTAGPNFELRVLIERGDARDTVVRSFVATQLDATLKSAADEVQKKLRRAPMGKKDSSVEDRARARATAAVRTWPDSSRSVLSVALVGPASSDELLASLSKQFAGLSPKLEAAPRSARGVDLREELIPVPGERQVEIAAGLPGVHRFHEDRRALELLNYIVGVPYYGGRLGWALTKSGLTYSSAAQTYFGDAGYILLSTTADTRNTPATIQAIREVVEGVGDRGVEEWELNEAKAFVLGRLLLYGPRGDTPTAALAAALVDSDASGIPPLNLPVLSRAYLDVTLEDINRVARTYYRAEKLKVVAMGAIPTADMKSPFLPGTFRALFEP